MATTAEIEGYIRDAAKARGIDPDVAVRVAKSEGLGSGSWQSRVVKNGRRETSYGPFQLKVDGGLGDKFKSKYKKSPTDESTVFDQVDFALDHAAKHGWGSWYGAAKVGVGKWTGLKNAKAATTQPASLLAGLVDAGAKKADPFASLLDTKPGGLGLSLPDTAPTPSSAPRGLGVSVAANDADVQRLEREMGMYQPGGLGVSVATNDADVQRLEREMGMYQPSPAQRGMGDLPVSVEMGGIPSSNPERAQRSWERMAPTTPDMMRQAGLLSNPNFNPVDVATDEASTQALERANGMFQPGGLASSMPSPERFGRVQTETLPSGGTLAYRPDIGPSQAEIADIAKAYASEPHSVARSKAMFDAMRAQQPGITTAKVDRLPAAPTVAPPQQQDLGGIGKALASVQGAVADQPPGTGSIIDAYDNIGPAMASIPAPDTYPDAPPQPTEDKHPIRDAMKRAAMGGLVGGLPGALMGLASGMFGEGGIGSGMFDGPGPIDKFSVGSGLKAMERAMSGARGATARASNGTEYTSLGPGMGGFRTSGKYGWTERVGPDGSTRAGGNARGLFGGLADAFGAGGGLMGDRPGGLGGFFGGLFGGEGRSSKKDRDKYSGGKGLY